MSCAAHALLIAGLRPHNGATGQHGLGRHMRHSKKMMGPLPASTLDLPPTRPLLKLLWSSTHALVASGLGSCSACCAVLALPLLPARAIGIGMCGAGWLLGLTWLGLHLWVCQTSSQVQHSILPILMYTLVWQRPMHAMMWAACRGPGTCCTQQDTQCQAPLPACS